MSLAGRRIIAQLALAVVVIACGLAWRMAPLGLPTSWIKYGGSILWGAMVLLIVGAFVPARAPSWIALAAAMVIAGAVEAFRLVHAPALDAFRLTLPGALLLGRVFSGWDLLAYAAGIVAALPVHVASVHDERRQASAMEDGEPTAPYPQRGRRSDQQ